MNFRADLHCHSTCSDGSMSPEEIIDLACATGLSGLSITDHDTIDAYTSSLFKYAAERDIGLVSGVEFSCLHWEKSVHILGYAFDPLSEPLLEFCEKHRKRRINRVHAILERLSDAGMDISAEEILVNDSASIGRPHIALTMKEHGYVDSVEEAFKKHIGDGKPCYVKGDSFKVEETIEIIHKAGGIAVIAHPHLIKNRSVVRDLLRMNFDGIECYYANFDKQSDLRWVDTASQKGWLVTGGSDFHGEVKPHIKLGASWAPEKTFHLLTQRFSESCEE